jgi:hypothetical protein
MGFLCISIIKAPMLLITIVGIEVLTAVIIRVTFFWDKERCGPYMNYTALYSTLWQFFVTPRI